MRRDHGPNGRDGPSRELLEFLNWEPLWGGRRSYPQVQKTCIAMRMVRVDSGWLLNALLLCVPADQGIEYGEDVAPVFDHAIEDVPQFRVALGVAVPLQQYRRRHLDVAAQLLGRVPAQEQSIEERRFALRKREVCGDLYGNDLGDRGHKEKCSLPKSVSASSGTVAYMSRAGQLPVLYARGLSAADRDDARTVSAGYRQFPFDTTPGLPGDSNRRRML